MRLRQSQPDQTELLSVSELARDLVGPPHSPKRPRVETAGLADVFPYYAGFSYEWARDQLASQEIPASGIVLDPWNGSGTTTLAAQANGLRSVGVDLNPVANIIAQLRTQVSNDVTKMVDAPRAISPNLDEHDPLRGWFSLETCARLRQWANAARSVSGSSSALAYVAMFRVVRRLTRDFEGSNPTWVRRASESSTLVEIDWSALDGMILEEQSAIKARLGSLPRRLAPTALVTGSATNLPLADKSVAAIVTSPPYLTRIDYAVAYSRELAVIGVDISRDRRLRAGLMGTTLVRSNALNGCSNYGDAAAALVKKVAAHPSKASGGYYLKQVRQYLDDLTASLDEASRVSSKNAVMILVVQGSYYKDVPVLLAEICTEEAQRRGWVRRSRQKYEVKRFLTQLNTAARAYDKGQVAETVITFGRV